MILVSRDRLEASQSIKWAEPGHSRVCARGLVAPRPIQSQISVVSSLAIHRVTVAEEQLKTGIAELVVTADVQQRGGFRLRRRLAFGPVVEELGAQRQRLAKIPLNQPARIWKCAVTGNAR